MELPIEDDRRPVRVAKRTFRTRMVAIRVGESAHALEESRLRLRWSRQQPVVEVTAATGSLRLRVEHGVKCEAASRTLHPSTGKLDSRAFRRAFWG